MVSYGFDHQVGLVPCRVNFFAPGYACGRMIVETFNSEVVEQASLGIMLIKNFTEPVYQKIGQVRALNFNVNCFNWPDCCRVRNQVRQRPRGVLKHLRKRGTESFKSNVGSVLKNSKARHGIVGEEEDRSRDPAATGPGAPDGNAFSPLFIIPERRLPGAGKRKVNNLR